MRGEKLFPVVLNKGPVFSFHPGPHKLCSQLCLLDGFHNSLMNCAWQFEKPCSGRLSAAAGPGQALVRHTQAETPVLQRTGCVTSGRSLNSELLRPHGQNQDNESTCLQKWGGD